ncbi:MAG TPA: hypothetical protein PLV52_06020, partial [Candidatus Omnitrophota bacterium]|nr:hypothetical protein [Candidatus Omnitrophota bacterium]
MKKNLLRILVLALSIAFIYMFLNIDVTTRKGIDYNVSTIKIPLYLKALDFIDRHYNYVQLTKNIIDGSKDEQEKALRIYIWVGMNIKKNPAGMPVVDDHPLNIVIRGYGVEDQFEDVFTILCTYAGLEAFYEEFQN